MSVTPDPAVDSPRAEVTPTARPRLPGPDVVRAIALIGVVVLNYHGYLLIRGGGEQGDGLAERVFDPFDGPLATRFAATFVLVAGVGVTLLTRSSVGDPTAMASARWRLVRRGLVLYVAGLVLDTIWPGTILPFYGAMFVIAGIVVTWRSRWILALGAAAAIAAAGIAWFRFERADDGVATTWFDGVPSSPRTLLLDVAVNGTHPLLPWLAFFCAGIVLGRVLGEPLWRPICFAGGLTLFGAATLVSDGIMNADTGSGVASLLASNDPFDRGLLYVASTLGTSLVAFAAISWLADRNARHIAVRGLRVAGQMSLTLYVAHALVFNLVVDWLGWIDPGGLDVALTFALGYWIVGIAAAWAWSTRFERGPLEVLYRTLTA